MGSWPARASAASITGACVFAVVTGAGAVFVGDWWGSSHHNVVVTQFVTTPASPGHTSHPAPARSTRPAVTRHHTSGGRTGSQAQADAQTVRVAGSAPAAPAHPAGKAAPANSSGPGQGPGGTEGQGEAQGNNGNGGGGGGGSQDPTSAPDSPTAAASTPAPATTPTAGGDRG